MEHVGIPYKIILSVLIGSLPTINFEIVFILINLCPSAVRDLKQADGLFSVVLTYIAGTTVAIPEPFYHNDHRIRDPLRFVLPTANLAC
jgi:hypothetical protein